MIFINSINTYVYKDSDTLFAAWIMGWIICKTVPYLQGVSVSASINTLVAISVERCLAICYPLKWQMTSRACRVVVAIIWMFSLVITLPWAIFFGLRPLYEGSELQVSVYIIHSLHAPSCVFSHSCVPSKLPSPLSTTSFLGTSVSLFCSYLFRLFLVIGSASVVSG